MTKVLIDTSVWIAFFRGHPEAEHLNSLIDVNAICVNQLIRAELIPALTVRKEFEIIELLNTVHSLELRIDWEEIIYFQEENLKHGINHVGIPDLVILQNALQHKVPIFSFDKHFSLMTAHLPVKLYQLNTAPCRQQPDSLH